MPLNRIGSILPTRPPPPNDTQDRTGQGYPSTLAEQGYPPTPLLSPFPDRLPSGQAFEECFNVFTKCVNNDHELFTNRQGFLISQRRFSLSLQ